MATVYPINRGVNRSLEFKGIKAQYVIYLALGLVLLLLHLFESFTGIIDENILVVQVVTGQ